MQARGVQNGRPLVQGFGKVKQVDNEYVILDKKMFWIVLEDFAEYRKGEVVELPFGLAFTRPELFKAVEN